MYAIREILHFCSEHLKKHFIRYPKRQAEELMCYVLGMKRIDLYLNFERLLEEEELAFCRRAIKRRVSGEPLQYIRGVVDFYGCSIVVDSRVLIPRPETEVLVDKIAYSLSKEDLKGKILWDVCCGSGCIGISLKKRFPDLKVMLSDLSASALETARENAKRNGVEASIVRGDLLEPFKGMKTHYLVSNPPYISREEYEKLDREVKGFEPELALLGGETGFEFYKRLAKDLPSHLLPLGKAWLEIGYRQGESIYKIFSHYPWKTRSFEKDWAGLDRFFFLEKEEFFM